MDGVTISEYGVGCDEDIVVRVCGLPWIKRRYSAKSVTLTLFGRPIARRPVSDQCRLGVSYNLFDGEELLEASIRSIRRQAMFVNAELARAKRFVVAHGIRMSAVCWYNYIRSPRWRMLEPSVHCVPFIMKIPRFPWWAERGEFPCYADGTRSLVRKGRFYLFPRDEAVMHHMSFVRKDLVLKARNSSLRGVSELATSRAQRLSRIAEWRFGGHADSKDIDFFEGSPVVVVPDEFGVGEV